MPWLSRSSILCHRTNETQGSCQFLQTMLTAPHIPSRNAGQHKSGKLRTLPPESSPEWQSMGIFYIPSTLTSALKCVLNLPLQKSEITQGWPKLTHRYDQESSTRSSCHVWQASRLSNERLKRSQKISKDQMHNTNPLIWHEDMTKDSLHSSYNLRSRSTCNLEKLIPGLSPIIFASRLQKHHAAGSSQVSGVRVWAENMSFMCPPMIAYAFSSRHLYPGSTWGLIFCYKGKQY